jgi:hypothetical protein
MENIKFTYGPAAANCYLNEYQLQYDYAYNSLDYKIKNKWQSINLKDANNQTFKISVEDSIIIKILLKYMIDNVKNLKYYNIQNEIIILQNILECIP